MEEEETYLCDDGRPAREIRNGKQLHDSKKMDSNSNGCLWKLNCWVDLASVGWSSGSGGISNRQINRPWAVSWLETIALIDGLKTIPGSPPRLVVELDSLKIVHLLKGNDHDITELGGFIEQAHKLISERSDFNLPCALFSKKKPCAQDS